MMRGGEKWDDLYDISSNILLFISYIFFGFATILLINAGVNYNKANIDETAVDAGAPLIEQPIFEYLKRDNFMAVEDYLLAFDIKKPLAIIFICIVFFGLIALVIKKEYKIILRVETLPYFLILIIFIAYTATTSNKNLSNSDNLFNYVVLHNHIKKKEDKQFFFKELKGVVLDMLDKNNTYSDTIKDNIAVILLSKLPSSFKDSKEGNIDIKIIKAILYTKETNVDEGIDNIEKIFTLRTADYNDEKNKVEYKNYIDDLFNLIINDNEPNSNNLYIKKYIYGLIKNKDNTDKNILKNKLIEIKRSIQAYYIVVFVFYCLILVAILIILMGGLPLCMEYIKVYWWDAIKLSFKVMVAFFLIYIPIWLTMFL
uniref:Uncharacterized protein n=1 Tax=viral metagenome TaxID=1070528 RepID=A0A6C0IAA4_9ZZZZ